MVGGGEGRDRSREEARLLHGESTLEKKPRLIGKQETGGVN